MPQRHKILITGSSGMLGIDLCQELSGDHALVGLDILKDQKSEGKAREYFECDITSEEKVADAILKARPDIVIHTAAWTDVDGCERDPGRARRINSEGTKNIASACKSAGVILIYISTDFVFDGGKKTPYIETDRPAPLSKYAESKLEGEEYIRGILKNYYILRTGWLYGKNGKNFVDTILEKAKAGNALKVVDDQVGSPTYTKDLAKAIRALIDKIGKEPGIYHVSNSGSVSWYEYAKEILRLKGVKTQTVPISSEELARPARRPAMSILDNSKFVGITGYKMRDWKKALKEYLER